MDAEIPVIRIDDPDDPRIAPYRDIRERDLVRRDGLFIAEGTTVLNVMLSAPRFAPKSLLVLENRLEGILAMAAGRIGKDMPLYIAGRAVMDAIAGFPMHRGVLAIGERPPETNDAEALLASIPRDATVIVAIGVANHDNMGAIFRNAAAFGADAVLIDATTCDPLYRKSIRVSVGGVLKVPFARCPDAPAAIALLNGHGFNVLALSPRGSLPLDEVTRTRRTALVLGTEGEGLPGPILAAVRTVRIKMREDFDSLNVATAAAIALARLYELQSV